MSAAGAATSDQSMPAQQGARLSAPVGSAEAPQTAGARQKPKRMTSHEPIEISTRGDLLQGRVTATQSPFLSGSVETLPKGARVDLTLMGNLNSEITQKGEEIFARVAVDLKDGERVLLPSGWYLHGLVADVASQRRLGRDGYVEVEFDKLVSPDGQYELPFAAKFSTADSQLKAVAKIVAVNAGWMTRGAIVGSFASVQATGLPVAIATHGISVGIGAGAGAGLGLIGALRRKGKIASLYPGDQTHLTIAEPLTLPGFNLSALPSSAARRKLKNLDLEIQHSYFDKDPYGDSHSRLLTVDVKVDNQTENEYSFFDLAIVSDHNQRYYPYLLGRASVLKKKVRPNSAQEGTISFSVDSPKHKYWLVLLDKKNREELSRVPVN